jgi:hypothetical protein
VSRRRPPWSSLGIDPTGDEREIKRAYAKKLKEIDVEAEPAKFIALRKQFEQAQSQARWIGADADDDDDGDADWADDGDEAVHAAAGAALASGTLMDADEWALGDVGGAAFFAPVVPPPARATPWGQGRDRVAAHFADIEAALRSADAGREGAVDRAVRALWAEPALETVDAAEDVEHRLAHMALNHGAAAAYLLRLASWHYGWARRAQQVGTGWPISEAGRRATAENWFQNIGEGRIAGHAKQVIGDLAQPPSGHWHRDFFAKRRITRFLDDLRRDHPEGEYRFDPDIVRAWERVRNPGISLGSLFGLVVLGAIAAIIVSWIDLDAGVENMAFWGFFLTGFAGVVAVRWGMKRVRPVRPSRYGGPLAARQAAALALMLAIFALAVLLPPHWAIGFALALATMALLPLTGAALPSEEERDPMLWALYHGRYLVMAAGLFAIFATVHAPHWTQAIVPGMLVAAAAQLLRERLVASWEALPPKALGWVRVLLLIGVMAVVAAGVRTMPDLPAAPAVLAGIALLLVQDAAANAWRPPLSTVFYFVYILLLVLFVAFPLLIPMALVARRLADRLFVKA